MTAGAHESIVHYKGGKRRGWRCDIDEKLLESMRVAGVSIRELAKHFGVSAGCIRWRLAYLAEHDDYDDRYRWQIQLDTDSILRMYRAKVPIRRIAMALGVSAHCIRYRLDCIEREN